MDQKWIEVARHYEGTREYPGAESNPVILYFWKLARLAGIKDDAVPWCSGFACAAMEEAGIRSPRSDSARSWLDWGSPLAVPVNGCVVVFKRPGGFHVGFVVGQDSRGSLQVLGGNQGDSVSIATFGRDRVLAYRWPLGVPIGGPLPILASVAQSSSEA